ncbi:MAG: 2-oxo acid dehydrogenase subunit E2 [Eubacteriales bacterium]|nr:2-oxo acid dehydrogenase subunit E2 [Eubacteriales bacterium]
MILNSRKDGKLVKGGDPMMHIMPYVMRGRNESAVYYGKSFCVENIQDYIREKRREGTRITLFNVIVSALLHTLYRRPHLNRFIAGRKLYQRNTMDVLYVVKTLMTDEGVESIAKITCDGHDKIEDVTEKMGEHISHIKGGQEKGDDKLIEFATNLPRFLVRFVLWILRILDFHGLMPKALMDNIPLYSSVFVSHMGSLGAEAPFHHLYEFGTTSIFVTIGKIYKKPYQDVVTGELEWKKTIDISFSIDERICDGFYLIKSLRLFETYIDDPNLLEHSPIELDLEHKQKLRQYRSTDEDSGSFLEDYWDNMMDEADGNESDDQSSENL